MVTDQVEFKSNAKSFTQILSIWFFFLILMYLFWTYLFVTIPMFPEDIEIYYATHPKAQLIQNIVGAIFDAIGVLTMVYIIKCISELETFVMNRDLKIDIINHLIED